MFVIEILRYGRADLGQHLFGAYNDLGKAIKDAIEYNWYRGGKYSKIIVNEFDLNKEMPFEHKSYIIDVELGNYMGVYEPEMIREDSMKDKIEALERELAELNAHANRKYKPQSGQYGVLGDGDVRCLALCNGAYTKNGRAFDTRDKAEKARDIMVKHDIILKYVIDHAPNYEPNEYDCASIFFCRDSGKWKRVLASDTDECVGTILMPIKIADKLADDLNNDRIDFN